jgi:O-antigen ligase
MTPPRARGIRPGSGAASRVSGERDLIGAAIRAGLMAVLAFSPLAFGGVHAWAYGVVWGVLWVLVALWGVGAWSRMARRGPWEVRWIRAPFQPPILLFGLWVAAQMVPLPSWLVGWIQPATLGARRLAAPLTGEAGAWVPWSLYPHGTWVGLVHLWSYGAVFYLVWYHLQKASHIRRFAFFWVGLGTFEALYGLVEYLGGGHRIWWWPNPYSQWVHGTFINRDHLAGYLEMTLLVAAGLLLALRAEGRTGQGRLGWRARLSRLARDDRWAKGLLLFFLCVLMGTALLLSLSRGAVMTLGVTFLPLSALLLLRRGSRRYGLVGLAVFIGMLLYAAPLGLEGLLEKFADLERGAADRWKIWAGAWQMAMAYPWAGTGWGTFEWTYPAFRPETCGEVLFDHAHNDWLELLAETGVVGVLLVLAGVVLYMASGLGAWRERRDPWAVWLGFSALASVAVTGTHSLGEFFFRTHANALTLAAVMAWGWVVLHHHVRKGGRDGTRWVTRAIRIPSWGGRCAMAALASVHLLLGVVMARHLLAESIAPTERDSTAARGEITDTALLTRAVALEPGNALRWSWLAREAMRQGAGAELAAWSGARGLASQGAEKGEASWARVFAAEALRLNPTWPDHYIQMGWILASREEWRREGLAEHALRAAVRLEPASPARRLHLGHYLLLDRRHEEAEEAFREVLRMAPHLEAHVKRELALLGRKGS